MPIQLKCPNGHRLTAKESNAGKTGKCPVCKAAVSIPVLHRSAAITDSAVISILGAPSAAPSNRVGTTLSTGKKVTPPQSAAPAATPAGTKRSDSTLSSASMPHVKLCPSCEREIDMGYHICPHCHTYITGLNDF